VLLHALVLLFATTPVSVQLELSESTRARVGAHVRELIEQRLQEEGFALEPRAALKLRVEELHGALRLTATLGAERFTREIVAPKGPWKEELSLELAQRLTVLAHEAETSAPSKPQPKVEVAAPPKPVEEEPEPSPPPAPKDPPLHLTAGLRVGVLVRPPSVDPTLAFHGSVPGGLIEPVGLMGVTLAQGPGLTAWEVPLALGIRLPIALSTWRLTPELLIGARLHFYTESAVDTGGARVDFLGMAGLSLLAPVGPFKMGVRLGVDLAAGREHVLGDQVLWSRGTFGFSAQLHIER
jgi:hypothetical protein